MVNIRNINLFFGVSLFVGMFVNRIFISHFSLYIFLGLFLGALLFYKYTFKYSELLKNNYIVVYRFFESFVFIPLVSLFLGLCLLYEVNINVNMNLKSCFITPLEFVILLYVFRPWNVIAVIKDLKNKFSWKILWANFLICILFYLFYVWSDKFETF